MLIQSNRLALPLHRVFAKSAKQASPGVSMRTGTDKIYVSQNSLAVLIWTSSLDVSGFCSSCFSCCTACSSVTIFSCLCCLVQKTHPDVLACCLNPNPLSMQKDVQELMSSMRFFDPATSHFHKAVQNELFVLSSSFSHSSWCFRSQMSWALILKHASMLSHFSSVQM